MSRLLTIVEKIYKESNNNFLTCIKSAIKALSSKKDFIRVVAKDSFNVQTRLTCEAILFKDLF